MAKAKSGQNETKKIVEAVKKSNQVFFMGVSVIFLLLLIMLSFFVLISSINSFKIEKPAGKIIGGEKDEGGCLIGAGYSWCESKNKCLRVWEESCEELSLSNEDLVRLYIAENIHFLNPNPSNGSVLTVSEMNFLSDTSVFVGYDDGENFYNAEAVFDVLPDKEVVVEKFIVKNKNGEEHDLQACVLDKDCIPLPSDCHPQACINKKYTGRFVKPEMCTMLFDMSAAYSEEDCACDIENKECYNKNASVK